MAFTIFNGSLTNAFQATAPIGVAGENVVFDWFLTVTNTLTPPGTAAQIEWYPEFTSADPNAAGTRWFRETAEEDIGNGEVRMPKTVRRFTENGDDLPLAEGTHALDTQFARKHNFCRLQVRVAAGGADTCQAEILAVLGVQPLSA
jgi:hypothetical protein